MSATPATAPYDLLLSYLGPQFTARLSQVREVASRLWSQGAPLLPDFTLHGPAHANGVEHRIADILAPEHDRYHKLKDLVTQDQVFFLLCSASLHDIGMIAPLSDAEIESARSSGVSDGEYIRSIHQQRTKAHIQTRGPTFSLRAAEIPIIADLCEAHREVNLHSLSRQYPDLRFLAAVLRLADELDITEQRAPAELLALRWSAMSQIPRWHWLKHYCVPMATAVHEELLDGKPRPTLRLYYEVVIKVPSEHWRKRFWTELLKPIDRVLRTEGIEAILAEKGLIVEVARFSYSTHYANEVLPDGTELEACFAALFEPDEEIPVQFDEALDRLPVRLPPVKPLLRRGAHSIAIAARKDTTRGLQVCARTKAYLANLVEPKMQADITAVTETYKTAVRELFAPARVEMLARFELEETCLAFADLCWRLMVLCGKEEGRRVAQLSHLVYLLNARGNDLYAWLTVNDSSPEIRKLSVEALTRFGTSEYYEAIFRSTTDSSPEVREAGIRGFSLYRGSRTLERLAQAQEGDVDENVRRTASEVLRTLIGRPVNDALTVEGGTVVICDSDNASVIPVVDALIAAGIEVRVVITLRELHETVAGWKPDVVVCDVGPTSMGESRGLEAAQFVRQALGDNVALITTGVTPECEQVTDLLRLRAVHVRKPTTTDNMARTVINVVKYVRSRH